MQYLAVCKLKPDVSRERLGPLLKPEAEGVWQMLAAGVLRSIHYIEGPAGAVLLLEAADKQQAEQHVRQLPLVEQGLLNVEILSLTPFTGYSSLFASPIA